ncbi:MAG: DUF2828 family protein [Clostridia bacterium]|nr:DUF2828 family protein [Clostridia bacterium]
MSFKEQMKTEFNLTSTLNGAVTHSTSGDACLDFFAVSGGMRYRRKRDQIRLFEKAYIETPDLAMKLLFHVRDIRQGMGERQLFRTLLRHVAKVWPESAKKNVRYIAEYGRWDDMMCLLNTPAEKEAVSVIKEQLEKDLESLRLRENGQKAAPISLLAKWLPSVNASSKKTCAMGKRLAEEFSMDEKSYRRMLSSLRANICLTERYLTKKTPEKINYEAVPAGAMLKYRCAFEKHDGERFDAYLRDVGNLDKQMHADTLFPYEILRPFFKNGWVVNEAKGGKTLEMLWESMRFEVGSANALSVIDTSGSMYYTRKDAVTPALISQAMGIYCAERCKGLFHNMFITFNTFPTLMEIKGNTLSDKLRYLSNAPWGGSTDLERVFDLILVSAVKAHAPQDELPEVLYIFSDMEFNEAIQRPDETIFENARRKFENAGYRLPAVVFHNVNSWQMQTPVQAHTKGAALTSGASAATLTEKFDGNVTPMSHMLRVLNGKRYEVIHA